MNEIERSFGTVLIIGGAGMLGRYTVLDLIKNTQACRPTDVHLYDRKTYTASSSGPFHSPELPPSNYHAGDFSDAECLERALNAARPAVVFDLVSPPMFIHDLAFYMKVNVEARSAALRMACEAGVAAYVYNSSAGVVHDSFSDLPGADESYPVLLMPQQREPYSHSKAVAEAIVLSANSERSPSGNRMRTAAARLCSPFGASHGEVTSVIVANARAGKYRFQIGDNKNLTDWTYVENGVRGYLLIAQALLAASDSSFAMPEDRRVDGEAFFLTNAEPVPFWNFARGLGAAAGYPVRPEEIRVLPRGLAMIMATISEWTTWLLSFGKRSGTFTRHGVRYSTITRYHSIEKARTRLHYEPFIGLEEGMKRATASYRESSEQ